MKDMKRKILSALIISSILSACENEVNQQKEIDSAATVSYKIDSTQIKPDTNTAVILHADTPSVSPVKSESLVVKKAVAKPAKVEAQTITLSDTTIREGKLLIGRSDCLTCHKVEGKLIGPAYTDVAKKYKTTDANINYLAGKILNGGGGVWGEVVMTPHPNIPSEDAKKMSSYILSLKK